MSYSQEPWQSGLAVIKNLETGKKVLSYKTDLKQEELKGEFDRCMSERNHQIDWDVIVFPPDMDKYVWTLYAWRNYEEDPEEYQEMKSRFVELVPNLTTPSLGELFLGPLEPHYLKPTWDRAVEYSEKNGIKLPDYPHGLRVSPNTQAMKFAFCGRTRAVLFYSSDQTPDVAKLFLVRI